MFIHKVDNYSLVILYLCAIILILIIGFGQFKIDNEIYLYFFKTSFLTKSGGTFRVAGV